MDVPVVDSFLWLAKRIRRAEPSGSLINACHTV